MDKDGDGFLSASDLEEYAKLHPKDLDKDTIELFFKLFGPEFGNDGDGKISYASKLHCSCFKKATKFDKIYQFFEFIYLIKLILFIF